MLTTVIMTDKIQKFWDKQAGRYDSAEVQFDNVYKDVIATTRKYLKIDHNVLDFGCATGTKTIRLAGGIKHIHGLDISAEMINEAIKKRDKANIHNISFSRGTIYNEEFENASFDAIIAFGIIHLLEDKEEAIRRIYGLLKPGGYFISTTACFKDKMEFRNKIEFKIFLISKRLGIMPLHLNIFSTNDVKELMGKHNFQIIEAETIFSGMTSVFIVARKL